MADYWKSQPRKFCQYCKCWIADNKPSIEFHERGKNHKENVAAKIAEIKKKSIEKVKQEERMSKQFAAMEDAAQKAYEEDLKRIERESLGLPSPVQKTVRPQPFQPQPQPPKKQQKKEHKTKKKWTQKRKMEDWVEGQTDDGHTYYYNTITGESQWEKPLNFQGERLPPVKTEQAESSSGCAWMEAVSPDGYKYYYNTETGESSWENPADLPVSEESESASNREGEGQEEPSAPEPEPLSGGESSSSITAETQEVEVPEQASQQPKVPKISFRKRKAEAEPPEKDDKASDDTPKEDAEEKKIEEVVPSVVPEPEKNVQVTTQTQAKRHKSANPYGTWEKIKQEVDPYAKVDLQLPQVEGCTPSTQTNLPPEPKPKFKERIITSIGEEGGTASFRKNKTQNGKSRSLRQRDNDD